MAKHASKHRIHRPATRVSGCRGPFPHLTEKRATQWASPIESAGHNGIGLSLAPGNGARAFAYIDFPRSDRNRKRNGALVPALPRPHPQQPPDARVDAALRVMVGSVVQCSTHSKLDSPR